MRSADAEGAKALRRMVIQEGVRAFGLMAGCHVVCIILFSLLLSDTAWVQWLSTSVVLAVYLLLAWADGAARGEKSVAMSEDRKSTRLNSSH